MKDNLEKFVEQHRGKFDDEGPASDVWDRIDHHLPVQHRKVQLRPLAFAASLAAVALAGWFVASVTMKNEIHPAGQGLSQTLVFPAPEHPSSPDTLFVPVYIPSATGVKPENNSTNNTDLYAEITKYYSAEIQKRKSKLYSVSSGNEQIISQIEEELAMIDTLNSRTRRDLGNGMNAGVVMEQLVQNYRQSIDILDMMLEQVNEEYAQSNP